MRDILKELVRSAYLGEQLEESLISFFESYKDVPSPPKDLEKLFKTYISLVQKEVASPSLFSHFHKMERTPFDFFAFSLDMVRPLIDFSSSKILGEENLLEIDRAISRRENVILLANHQAEIDPQVISLLLSSQFPHLAMSMAFVAGHRVTSDPLAIPFSRGTNIFTIYSKKYIESPLEKKTERLQHNAKTISALETSLSEGGLCVFVAPSGGRDRYDLEKNIHIAPFDPNSVEMFYLLAKHCHIKTHIHLLAVSTIDLLPPPKTIHIELGEDRTVSYGPAGLFFGPALPADTVTKEERKARSDILTNEVEKMFQKLL